MTINQPIEVIAQFSTDGKGFKKVGIAHQQWASSAEFLSNTPATRRHDGMFGYITPGQIWHFVGGITDDKFIQFSVDSSTSILPFDSVGDFPGVGFNDKLYIAKDTWTPYIWDGASYNVLGNPGPMGSAGSTGADGPANSLAIGTVTTGITSSATISGTPPSQTLDLVLEKGADGAPGAPGAPTVTLRVNGTDNPIQSVLDFIDSTTIKSEYVLPGKIKLSTLPRILAEVKAGTSDAITAGVIVGDSTYTNARLIGNLCEVNRGGYEIANIDMGGGSEFVTKLLASDTITFSSPINADEYIKIKLA